MGGRVFFLLSCARSGSTSLARILDGAKNGVCVSEPEPNLARESRLAMDGRLEDVEGVVRRTVVARAAAARRHHEVYGEKNVTYGPFVRNLFDQLDSRFVFLHRDGREVVRSLVAWHEGLFGNVYRECADPGQLQPRALEASARTGLGADSSDFARPRPLPGDPWFEAWEQLGRHEMCAWYWARINRLYRETLAEIPSEAWVELDYTRPQVEDLARTAEFLGLQGLDPHSVASQLDRRINSLADRGEAGLQQSDWRCWDGGVRRRFSAIAGEVMRALGHWDDPARDWWVPGYGQWWDVDRGGLPWYRWMFESREVVHRDTLAWIRGWDGAGDEIGSVADFGCGLGVGYADELADRRYVGFDLSGRNIQWCRSHRDNPRHDWSDRDFIVDPPEEKFDLVMSSGTIDNAYDADAFLAAMVRSSRRFIHLTCYRGWFPHLEEHVYSWNPEHHCFYNDLSPQRIEERLIDLGCVEVAVEPVVTQNPAIPYETRVTARVPEGRAGA